MSADAILIDSEHGLCPICKKDILECAVIEYQEFFGVQIPVCQEHIKYGRK